MSDPGLAGLLRDVEPSAGAYARVLARARRRRARRLAAAGCAVAGVAVVALVAAVGLRSEPTAASEIRLGGSVVDSAARGDALWVLTCAAHCGGEGRRSRGELVRIDAASGRVVLRVPVERPQAVAAGPEGLWTLDFWNGVAVRRSPDTGAEVARTALSLPEPIVPGDRAFLPFDVAVGAGAVWVSTARGRVARIDPVTNRVTRMLRIAPESSATIVAGAGAVWVGDVGEGVLRVDAATGRRTRVGIADARGRRLSVGALALAAGAVWATGAWTDRIDGEATATDDAGVAEIDPRTGRVRGVGTLPRGLALAAADGGALWFARPGGRRAYRYDAGTGAITDVARLPARGAVVAASGSTLWIARPGGALVRFDAS